MHVASSPAGRDRDDELIARALATSGGHLTIGRGGFTLWYDRGCRMSGYDVEPMRAACIAAGLPVIDSREVSFERVCELAIRGPMVAVGEEPSAPPYHALSYAPLRVIGEAYRTAGAEVFNLGGAGAGPGG